MDIQQLFAVLIAIGAVGYLVRRSMASLRTGSSGCGTCSDCPADSKDESLPIRKQLYSLGDSE